VAEVWGHEGEIESMTDVAQNQALSSNNLREILKAEIEGKC
jgi:hypothetical protein